MSEQILEKGTIVTRPIRDASPKRQKKIAKRLQKPRSQMPIEWEAERQKHVRRIGDLERKVQMLEEGKQKLHISNRKLYVRTRLYFDVCNALILHEELPVKLGRCTRCGYYDIWEQYDPVADFLCRFCVVKTTV
jgi:hypothetical protein